MHGKERTKLQEVHRKERARHGEGERHLDDRADDHADPGGEPHAARVQEVALGPEFADRRADQGHDEDPDDAAEEDADHGADERPENPFLRSARALRARRLGDRVDHDPDHGENAEKGDRLPAHLLKVARPADEPGAHGDEGEPRNRGDDRPRKARGDEDERPRPTPEGEPVDARQPFHAASPYSAPSQ